MNPDVALLVEALRWALAEGGWRMPYFADEVPDGLYWNGWACEASIDSALLDRLETLKWALS